jgi:Beta/Gamma crystallin
MGQPILRRFQAAGTAVFLLLALLQTAAAAQSPPSGSYQRSCNGAFMSGSVLIARCRDNGGRMVSTQLDIRGCRQDIANINGNLTCQGQGSGAIKVFAGVGWQGPSRTIQSAIGDLAAIGFGNSIQSIAIPAGTWEFCTGTYFGGRCVKLNHGIANLRDFGLAFQIMSIRPVY